MITPQEAKKIIFNQWQSFLEDNIDYGGISEAYKMAMKALEQQLKTGKWIGGSICNRCNYKKMPLWQYNYCPNCGADMRESEDKG